jgi:hypothetical protein
MVLKMIPLDYNRWEYMPTRTKMKKFVALLTAWHLGLLLSALPMGGQNVVNRAFGDGEKLLYVGSFNLASLWTNIAEITLEVNKMTDSSSPVLRLVVSGQTFSEWDSHFKLRDLYQSWVEPESGKPLIFKRDILEGKYTKDEKYIFNRKSNIVESTVKTKQGKVTNATVKITAGTYDLISFLYLIRNLDYDRMAPDQATPVSVLIDERLETIVVKYKGVETLQVDKLGAKKCHKLTVNIQNSKILKQRETNNLWLTADANRIPVLVKVEIPVGSIQLKIVEATGLRN